MFIEKKMIEKIEEYIQLAKEKEENVICYLDKDNNNEEIKRLLFLIGKKEMKIIIGKKMKLHIEGLDCKQDIIFLINDKEKLDYITERIEDWKEDFIPLMLEEQLIEIMGRNIVMLIERKNTYIEWRTNMKIKKQKIEYVTEDESSAIIDFLMIEDKKLPLILEFNIFKFQKDEQCGTIALQYVQRYQIASALEIDQVKKAVVKNHQKPIYHMYPN